MASPDGSPVAAHDAHRAQLGPDVPFSLLERFAFYDAIRSADVGLVIATGDERPARTSSSPSGCAEASPTHDRGGP